jgi:hypothetical protein
MGDTEKIDGFIRLDRTVRAVVRAHPVLAPHEAAADDRNLERAGADMAGRVLNS